MNGHIARGAPLKFEPADPRTLPDVLYRNAQHYPRGGIGAEGYPGGPRFTAFPDLRDTANSIGNGLLDAGISPGDTVLLQISQIDDFLTALWGCLLRGISPVATTVPRYTPGEPTLDRMLGAWDVLDRPALLCDDETRAAWAALPAAHPLREARVVSAAACAAYQPATARPDIDSDAVALYMLSSGSTGTAKVMPLTHRGLMELGVAAREQMRMRPGDVAFNWMPIDHSGALLVYHFAPLWNAASAWYAPTDWVLTDPLRWLEVLSRREVQHSFAPNFAFRLVADALRVSPQRFDLHHLTGLLCGGEQIHEAVIDDFLRATASHGMTAARILAAWGMTETCSAITFGWYDEPGAIQTVRDRRYVSVGHPSPGAELRVVDHDGHPLDEAEVGRLEVRSARVTPRYLGQENAAFGADGWFDTGDLAALHGDRLTIVGRVKELIVLNGNNYACHEIEEVAGAAPGVRADRVAAVGVPDEAHGSELLGIAFVAEPGHRDPTGSVRELLREKLGLVPAIVTAVDEREFPLTGSGKIRRTALRDELSRRRKPAPARVVERAGLRGRVTAVFAEVLGFDVVTDRPLYEQGVDSVRLPRLAATLTKALDRPISTTTLLSHPHVDAFLASLDATVTASPSVTPGTSDDQRVAVIGMAGRFPGADSVDTLWDNLRAGVDSVRRFSPQQLAAAGVPAATYERPDYVPVSGVLGDGDPAIVTDFAAALFGISAREAALTDPQHRLFLEVCHQLLEEIGYATGPRVGVFAGSGMNLYTHHSYMLGNLRDEARDPLAAMQTAMGNQPDFLVTRAAYRLNLTGPAINVQTACSTGLVATHLAAQSVLSGDSEVAIAGAAAVHIPQTIGYTYMDGSILSATGSCRPFDAAANGTVGGNGIGAVALKRLDRALADGDTVHAVMLGSAVNNDGANKVGFTAPSVSGQVAAITAALDRAAISANDLGYVETHGTGTRLGDPLEIEALTAAFAARGGNGPCALGAVKANIGHLDSCAGIAGLVKTILTVREGVIAPQINFDAPNPAINLDETPFFISPKETVWDGATRRAGVQALGVGGTNAHVILESPPDPVPRPADNRYGDRPAVVLSAQTATALRELSEEFARRLRDTDAPERQDLLASTALGRQHRRHRLVAWGQHATDIAAALENPTGPDAVRAEATQPGPVAFVFSGQGSWRTGMIRALYDTSAAFGRTLDDCAHRYRTKWNGDLFAILDRDDATEHFDTDAIQPALFAYQTALTAAWSELGVRPDLVAGHSVGEYAAWCAAGAMSIADGLDLTTLRGRLMCQRTPPGAMLAVRADKRAVSAVCAVVGGLDLAVVNGPRDHVLSGEPDAIAEAANLLERRDIITKPVPVRRAFHSALLDPMLPKLREALDAISFAPGRLPVASTIDGALRSTVDADYFVTQTRRVARWDAAMASLADAGCGVFLEIGPDRVLTALGRRLRPEATWLPSHDGAGLSRALAGLHCAGVAVDWSPLATDGGRVRLPTHPLHRETYWIESTPDVPPLAEEKPR